MDEKTLLQEIGKMIDGVRSELKQEMREMRQEINCRFQSVDDRFQSIDGRLQGLERNLHETRMIVESLPEQIRLIAEQHTDIIGNQKVLEANLESYDDTKSRVSTLERVVKVHTSDIAELKKAAV